MSSESMTTRRPYLIEAIYKWIIDNNLTPNLLVNAKTKDTKVPPAHIEKNGTIILNIAPAAIRNLNFGLQNITFNAAFPGLKADIHLPIESIKAIYAAENGQGLIFDAELDGTIANKKSFQVITGGNKKSPSKQSQPNLKIVKDE